MKRRPSDIIVENYLKIQLEIMDQMNIRVPKEFHYKNQYDFILKHGKFYQSKELDSTEKRIIKKALRRIGFVPQKKECFYNAQMLALTDNTGKIKYCEGFALTIMPTNHAWIEINGKVVDVTWNDKEGNMILGIILDEKSYFGVNIDKKIIREKQARTMIACSFLDDYNDGHQLFRQPFEEFK